MARPRHPTSTTRHLDPAIPDPGPVSQQDTVQVTLALPAPRPLAGINVLGQAYVTPAVGSAAYLTNVDCKSIHR